MNVVALSGTIGKDCVTQKLTNGTIVVNTTICVTKKEHYTWINLIGINDVAKWMEMNISKDDFVELVGELQTRSWGKDDERRYITEVLIHRIIKDGE